MKTSVPYLTKLLYDHDPMGTCCLVNRGMEDEYIYEAQDIHQLLKQGIPFKQAYFSVMSYWFDPDYVWDKYSAFFKISETYYNQ
jgi:hypothetical protein